MSASAAVREKHKDVDPFLLYKWERIFTAFFDTNAGGDVDWGDFYLVVRKVRDIYGAESDQMTYAKNSMKALWEGLLGAADQNKDEVITVDEWITFLKSGNQAEAKWFKDYLTYMFKLFDVSADNLLDIAEYSDGMYTYGTRETPAHEAFKLFAVDKTGSPIQKLDWFQWRDRFNEYLFSKDKKAPGNHLFGVLKIQQATAAPAKKAAPPAKKK